MPSVMLVSVPGAYGEGKDLKTIMAKEFTIFFSWGATCENGLPASHSVGFRSHDGAMEKKPLDSGNRLNGMKLKVAIGVLGFLTAVVNLIQALVE